MGEGLGIIIGMNCRFPPSPEVKMMPCVLIPDRQPGGFGVTLLPPDNSTPIPLPIRDTDPRAVWDSVCQLIIDFEQSAPRSSPPWLRPTDAFLDALNGGTP